jgi:hypothetical protein
MFDPATTARCLDLYFDLFVKRHDGCFFQNHLPHIRGEQGSGISSNESKRP